MGWFLYNKDFRHERIKDDMVDKARNAIVFWLNKLKQWICNTYINKAK